jgi:GntR family transcriptional regulator, hexuronate regulon transcriptional repressor
MNKMDELAAKGANDRLYMDVARKLVAELVAGTWPVGSRLPAERELAAKYEVSRPTAREAVIALEVKGFVEVRTGSGIYVLRHPGDEDVAGHVMTAFELTESRLLIEGETAALAATQITDDQLAEIEALIDEIARENQNPKGSERADRQFHLTVAQAARNSGLLGAVTTLWDLRESSAEAALLHAKARTANIKPVVEEHTAILDALKARDPEAARAAMRAHLLAVMDGLLLAAEDGGNNMAKRDIHAALAR